MSELTLQAARRLDPKRVALALAGAWLVFAALGIMVDRGHGAWTFQAFNLADSDLDRRLSMPASFTALLVLLSAAMAFALARVDRTRRERLWRMGGFGLLLLGFEQLLGIHFWLQNHGLSWSVSYLPVLALAAYPLTRAMVIFRNQPGAQAIFGSAIVLWLAGGALDNPSPVSMNAGADLLRIAAG